MRRYIQLISLLCFLILFFLAAYPLQHAIPVDFFLRLDPLVALTVFLASRTLVVGMLWSVLLVISALISGRIFCGYNCPLGSILDFSDALFEKNRKYSVSVILHKLKFYLLIFVLISVFRFSIICGKLSRVCLYSLWF